MNSCVARRGGGDLLCVTVSFASRSSRAAAEGEGLGFSRDLVNLIDSE